MAKRKAEAILRVTGSNDSYDESKVVSRKFVKKARIKVKSVHSSRDIPKITLVERNPTEALTPSPSCSHQKNTSGQEGNVSLSHCDILPIVLEVVKPLREADRMEGEDLPPPSNTWIRPVGLVANL